MFVDEAKIELQAGKGGDGLASFRREKYVPRGGPAGGNGGRGGNIVLKADPNLTTLMDFRYQQHYKADSGESGGKTQKHGKDGGDLYLNVPVGTVVFEGDSRRPMADLTEAEAEYVIARGGRGGRGNAVFATSTRQAPTFAEKGEPGQARSIRLELKLLADVGLVGFPNVGKSTLIAACSAAKPKIADYPFTTLVPNLGVVAVEEKSFVMADIPGLIEGAHEGLGLGHQFLRHIERTRVILHILDVSGTSGRDPLDDYRIIRRELAAYSERLAQLPQIVAFNKVDIPGAEEIADNIEPILRAEEQRVFRISAATQAGLTPLLYALTDRLETLPVPLPLFPAEEKTVIRFEDANDDRWTVEPESDGAFRLVGPGVERKVVMTDLQKEEGVRRLHRQLQKMGVLKGLIKAGAKEGDTVRIGDIELDFVDDNTEWID